MRGESRDKKTTPSFLLITQLRCQYAKYYHFRPQSHPGGFEDDCNYNGKAGFWGGSWNNSHGGGKGPTNKHKKKAAEEKPEAAAVKEEAKSSA